MCECVVVRERERVERERELKCDLCCCDGNKRNDIPRLKSVSRAEAGHGLVHDVLADARVVRMLDEHRVADVEGVAQLFALQVAQRQFVADRRRRRVRQPPGALQVLRRLLPVFHNNNFISVPLRVSSPHRQRLLLLQLRFGGVDLLLSCSYYLERLLLLQDVAQVLESLGARSIEVEDAAQQMVGRLRFSGLGNPVTGSVTTRSTTCQRTRRVTWM